MSHDRGGGAEDAILERLLAGDEAAFSDLVSAYHGSLLRLALTFVGDRGAAEEVVQETWIGVIKGLPSFERRSSLGEPDEAPSEVADRFSATGRWIQPPPTWQEANPEDLLLRREVVECLEEAIDALPPTQRSVVTLRDIEGVEAAEVCNILQISETNQRVLLHRARPKIRKMVEKRLKPR